jgi:hypothetical protein
VNNKPKEDKYYHIISDGRTAIICKMSSGYGAGCIRCARSIYTMPPTLNPMIRAMYLVYVGESLALFWTMQTNEHLLEESFGV